MNVEREHDLEGQEPKPRPRRWVRIPRIVVEGESGQAIVLIALVVVILLGFTALAIDGGGLFLLQRDAQNAADAAAFAGAYAKCTGGNVKAAAEERAELDGFNDDGTNNWVTVNCTHSSCDGPAPQGSQYVEVVITANKVSYFSHLIFGGPLQATVHSVGECLEPFNPDDVHAIVSLAPCTGENSCPGPTVDSSGSSTTIDGGIAGGCGCEFTGSGTEITDGISCVPEGSDPVYGTCEDMGANWPHGGGSGNATCPDGEEPDDTPEVPVDPFAGYWTVENFDNGGPFADWAEADNQCDGNTVPSLTGRWPGGYTTGTTNCYTNIASVAAAVAGGAPDPTRLNEIEDYYFEGLYFIGSGELRIKVLNVGPAGATFVTADPATGRIRIEDIAPSPNYVQPYDVDPSVPPTDSACLLDPEDPGWNPGCFDPGPNQLPLAFANVDDDTCSTTTTNAGFSINGNSVTWAGIVYVPKAGCNWSGSSQTVYGAYVCRITDLSSSNSEIYFDPSTLPTVPPWMRFGTP